MSVLCWGGRWRVAVLVLIVCLAWFFSGRVNAGEAPNAQLFVANVDGSDYRQITHEAEWHFGTPAWSPDGTRIAVDGTHVRHFDQLDGNWSWSQTHLFVLNADGSDLKDLGRGAMPSWSPDGKLLVCHAYHTHHNIVVLKPDGTGHEGLTLRGSSPIWSPFKKQICRKDRGGFVLFDLATGQETTAILPQGLSPGLGYDWSNDARKVCFEDRTSKQMGVAFFDDEFQCQQAKLCTQAFQECSFPSWSADGKSFVFSGRFSKSEKFQIYSYELESDEGAQYLAWQDAEADTGDVDWSADGKRFVFCSDVEEE